MVPNMRLWPQKAIDYKLSFVDNRQIDVMKVQNLGENYYISIWHQPLFAGSC